MIHDIASIADKKPLPIALVSGASSQIGYFLLPRLVAAGFTVRAISRAPQVMTCPEITWEKYDITALPSHFEIANPSVLFHLAGLPLLPHLLQHPAANNLCRIIAFSSTSRLSKLDSPCASERNVAHALATAEAQLSAWGSAHPVAWTLFRPTLVYGCKKDKNIHFIQQMIQRYGFFPVPGQGKGLRQPVHADDLAIACLQAWNCPRTYGQAYHLSGGETLSYRDMVRAIFVAMQRPPRLLPVPLSMLRIAIYLLRKLPNYRHLTPSMALRLEQDLCFDHTAARRDFGYHPKTFHEGLRL